MMANCFYVGIGGFIGSVLRYLIGLLPVSPADGFPIKTLCINMIGSFVIALVSALAAKNSSLSPQLVLLLKVGICGGFTTFSTFAYETSSLLQKGSVGIAVTYVLLSVVLSVLAVFGAEMMIK